MKILVNCFVVTPCFVIINEETGLVCGHSQAPEFIMYPDKPFDIKKTIADIERLLGEKDEHT